MRLLIKAIQAFLIVLSIMMMIFLVLDGFNPTMNFLRNDITKGLLWAFSLLALADGLIVMGSVITGHFRMGKKRHTHRLSREE